MKFSKVAEYFERITHVSSRLAMTELFSSLLKESKPEEARIICYFAMGSLRAPYQGTQFTVAEKTLAAIVSILVDQSPIEVIKNARALGDLGNVLLQFKPVSETENPNLLDVYQELVEIEALSGTGSQETKAVRIGRLLKNIDPISGQYIIRIILGTLRLGLSDMTIIDALSWQVAGNKTHRETIEHAYNMCADIGAIAALVNEFGLDGVKDISIVPGIPVRPAAAERLPTAKDIFDKIGPCVSQPKLDGFRLQIHLDYRNNEKKVWFFSRNLINMSGIFPDLVKALDDLPVETIIFEGEAIGYDEETGNFVPFQETVKRKRKHGVEEAATEMPLKLFVFDLLYLNGQSMIAKAHHTRREHIEKLFPPYHTATVSAIDEKSIQVVEDLEKLFLESIESGLEGLVVKKPDSRYQPGKRNFSWIKLKRHGQGELEDTIDVVILGYYRGSGKRSAFGIGALLVGVYNKRRDVFETLAKIGTGLKDDDWIDAKKRLDKIKVSYQPQNIVCAKELYPDVWVNPELVCMVKADEITLSPLHTAGKTDHLGFALRFPRFIEYRTDKSAADVTTTHEIMTMFKNQKVRE